MAELDEKTQKLVDRAVKKQRGDDKKAVMDAFEDAAEAGKALDDKGAKKAVAEVLKDLKTGLTDVFAG